jgi:two-component system, cell cycle sensor histidine kinase and response regulator CckA
MNISQAEYRAIFDAVSDAVLIHEVTTGEILEVNRGMCEMFGYTRDVRDVRLYPGGSPATESDGLMRWRARIAAGAGFELAGQGGGRESPGL